ncbi:MAG: flagellar FlbD family protein [Elusimicrobia bacterium]|nr:flagellar FlbD family protein [Elusimicrobiota bacterium]
MIQLTRLNGTSFRVNAELIETVEACPDTVLSLATGNRIVVREKVDEVVARVIEYRKKVNSEKPAPNPIAGFERRQAS